MNLPNDAGSRTLRTFAITLALCVSSCGGDQDPQPLTNGPAATNTSSVGDANASLATTPIDLSTAYSSLAVEVPKVPICPWLSDADARASVDGIVAGKTLQRRRVTADACEWSVNAGFALKVQRTSLADAAKFNEIQYNMDVPAVLEPIDGFATNATLLRDPTWDSANPRLFGLGFDLPAERFVVRVIGLKTSEAQLRLLGQKLAASVPGSVFEPVVEGIKKGPTLEPCVFDPSVLTSLMGGSAGEAMTAKPSVDGSICEYRGTLRQGRYRVTLALQFSADSLSEKRIRFDNYVPASDIGENVYTVNWDSIEGPGNSSRSFRIGRPSGKIEMNLMVSDSTFPKTVVKTLIDNLIARTVSAG